MVIISRSVVVVVVQVDRCRYSASRDSNLDFIQLWKSAWRMPLNVRFNSNPCRAQFFARDLTYWSHSKPLAIITCALLYLCLVIYSIGDFPKILFFLVEFMSWFNFLGYNLLNVQIPFLNFIFLNFNMSAQKLEKATNDGIGNIIC